MKLVSQRRPLLEPGGEAYVKAIIFDCDGTLADTMPSHYTAWSKVTARHGLTFPEARFYSLGGVPVKKFAYADKGRDGRKARREIALPDASFSVVSRDYQKLIAKLEGKPEERILNFLMLRSLKQARYSVDNVGHFALAAKTYTHFTSPIRRYPDLVVHRLTAPEEWLSDWIGIAKFRSNVGQVAADDVANRLAGRCLRALQSLNHPPYVRDCRRVATHLDAVVK
jgi:hypothetical protein